MTKNNVVAPATPPPIARKVGPMWTAGILAVAGLVTLLILMLATGH